MSITIAEVKKIAELARIKLTPAEEERHAQTISAVLNYMKILNEVNTDGIAPTFQVTDLLNVVREDAIVECQNKKGLMKQMSQIEMDELVVPAVFNEE